MCPHTLGCPEAGVGASQAPALGAAASARRERSGLGLGAWNASGGLGVSLGAAPTDPRGPGPLSATPGPDSGALQKAAPLLLSCLLGALSARPWARHGPQEWAGLQVGGQGLLLTDTPPPGGSSPACHPFPQKCLCSGDPSWSPPSWVPPLSPGPFPGHHVYLSAVPA